MAQGWPTTLLMSRAPRSSGGAAAGGAGSSSGLLRTQSYRGAGNKEIRHLQQASAMHVDREKACSHDVVLLSRINVLFLFLLQRPTYQNDNNNVCKYVKADRPLTLQQSC